MMRVLKFPLFQQGETEIRTSAWFFTGLSAGFDRNGALCVWAEVRSESDDETLGRYFRVVGTGEELPGDSRFIATVFDLPHVWHVYEVFKD